MGQACVKITGNRLKKIKKQRRPACLAEPAGSRTEMQGAGSMDWLVLCYQGAKIGAHSQQQPFLISYSNKAGYQILLPASSH